MEISRKQQLVVEGLIEAQQNSLQVRQFVVVNLTSTNDFKPEGLSIYDFRVVFCLPTSQSLGFLQKITTNASSRNNRITNTALTTASGGAKRLLGTFPAITITQQESHNEKGFGR